MTTIAERRRQTAAPGRKVEMQIVVSVRGGSWFGGPEYLRSAFRFWWPAGGPGLQHWASGSPARLPLESLTSGVQGRSPGSNFF